MMAQQITQEPGPLATKPPSSRNAKRALWSTIPRQKPKLKAHNWKPGMKKVTTGTIYAAVTIALTAFWMTPSAAKQQQNCKKQFINGEWVLVCCNEFGSCKRV
jgi:hypothetical protein